MFGEPRAMPRKLVLAAVLSIAIASNVRAVAVSPVALYIDSRSRTGTLQLYNPGSRPEEIEVGFAFGYPVSDEAGTVTVPLSETAPAGEPSALEWLRAFPRRLVLEPGQRQTVRVLVEPPSGLPGGEYWARVLVRSRGGQPPIEERRGDVTVQIDVETVVVVALNYRNGKVETGVRVTGATAERGPASAVGGAAASVASAAGGTTAAAGSTTTAAGSTTAAAGRTTMASGGGGSATLGPAAPNIVYATVDLERLGNAAYIGAIRAQLLDARGRAIGDEADEVLAVYHGIRRRFALQVPPGAEPARVRFTIDSRRDDLPPGAALATGSVTHTTDIR